MRELKASDHIVPQSAEWYIKSAITKAILKTADECRFLIEVMDHPDSAEDWKQQAKGLYNLHVQWFKEALPEFQQLDPELVPYMGMLKTDYEYR